MSFYNYLSHNPNNVMYDLCERTDEIDVANSVVVHSITTLNNPIKIVDKSTTIYRYKFGDEFVEELYKFSKIHQYDHRKDFKTAWETWVEDNNTMILLETVRLTDLGYDGDILDKMFKSARYYFRKKSTITKEPAKRRKYCGLHKDVLDTMDNHIASNITNDDYKPSTGFDSYCINNIALLKDESVRLIRAGFKDSVEIQDKLKKTYKNRYFIFITK